jgi:hypothetical protein
LAPGLISGAADDDPSGIATYSVTGAQFGYGPPLDRPLLLPPDGRRRLRVTGAADFGEVLNLTFTVDATPAGTCAMSLDSGGTIPVPASGATGTIHWCS